MYGYGEKVVLWTPFHICNETRLATNSAICFVYRLFKRENRENYTFLANIDNFDNDKRD